MKGTGAAILVEIVVWNESQFDSVRGTFTWVEDTIVTTNREDKTRQLYRNLSSTDHLDARAPPGAVRDEVEVFSESLK
jgi:hypothetical protein